MSSDFDGSPGTDDRPARPSVPDQFGQVETPEQWADAIQAIVLPADASEPTSGDFDGGPNADQ